MAEVDDATVAARTKEILETDEAIKTQYGDGSLTVKTLRKAVAAALNAEESAAIHAYLTRVGHRTLKAEQSRDSAWTSVKHWFYGVLATVADWGVRTIAWFKNAAD